MNKKRTIMTLYRSRDCLSGEQVKKKNYHFSCIFVLSKESFKYDENGRKFSKRVENTVKKGECVLGRRDITEILLKAALTPYNQSIGYLMS